jgi:hypothetical protein
MYIREKNNKFLVSDLYLVLFIILGFSSSKFPPLSSLLNSQEIETGRKPRLNSHSLSAFPFFIFFLTDIQPRKLFYVRLQSLISDN